jgi:chlorite dismutase
MEVQQNKNQNKISKSTFLNYSFFKIDPKWRWMNEVAKEEAAKEFAALINVANTKMKVQTYSTLGLHEHTDFMLWMVSESIEKVQTFTSKIYGTILGKYIEPSYLFLSSLRRSIYSEKLTPSFMTSDKPLKYLIVYPFVKSREWYLLPFEERKKMMDEHITIGRKFPEIRLNTSYSYGLDDNDFTLAFETNDLIKFQDLIIQLRETKVSLYVVKDTPMIVCVLKDIQTIIMSLG